MALQKTITLSSGLVITNAYVRIDTVSGSKKGITVSVNSYISQSDFERDKGYLNQKLYSFIPSVVMGALNFIEQGYEYLKTLPDFVGAIDA